MKKAILFGLFYKIVLLVTFMGSLLFSNDKLTSSEDKISDFFGEQNSVRFGVGIVMILVF